MHGGVGNMGRHPNTWGCPNRRKAPCIPNHMQIPLEHTDAQGSIRDILGVFEHMGALGHPKIQGVSEHRGASECTEGIQMPPRCET